MVFCYEVTGCRLQKGERHLQGSLIHGRAHTALQHHLQNLRIRRLHHGRISYFLDFLLQVLNGHLDRLEYYLLLVNHRYSKFYIGKGAFRCEYSFALVLLVQGAVSLTSKCERCAVNKSF